MKIFLIDRGKVPVICEPGAQFSIQNDEFCIQMMDLALRAHHARAHPHHGMLGTSAQSDSGLFGPPRWLDCVMGMHSALV